MGQLNYTTEKTNELLDKVDGMPETVTDGKTPVLETGTTTTLDPGQNATSEVVANGTDDAGNPKYKLNFGIPKGYDGSGGSGGGGTADSVQWANVLNKPSWVNSSTKPAYTASEVGALPSDTQIPSKTSQLTNDSGFTTSASFKTINGQSIVGSGNIVIEGGGGDTPSAGGGNVNVTNGSSLKSASYYAFKPSADGSLDGTFSVIPNASNVVSGLMSRDDYFKLNEMKPVLSIPIAVLELTDDSTSEDIEAAFGSGGLLNNIIIYYAVGLTSTEYNNIIPQKVFIGNLECLLSGSVGENTYTLDFNYVDSGKLKTISITLNSSTSQFSCKLSESGGGADDTYYLPNTLYLLNAGATSEEILEAFGGSVDGVFNAIEQGKKFFIKYVSSLGNSSIPVTVRSLVLTQINVTFTHIGGKIFDILYMPKASGSYVKVLYPGGYELKPEVYSLTSSSSSEDISTAVGGESGLKNIIQAIKDGNRLVTRDTSGSFGGMTLNQDLTCCMYSESDNGDMQLVLSGIGYGLFGGVAGFLSINYTKSSNTFSCTYTPIS